MLRERPAEASDRAVPGHWEGDLIIGTGRSAIGTVVERSSRCTLLVHLPRLDGWGQKDPSQPPGKRGPSLGGYGAEAMNAALTASMTTLPQQLRKTLTWDRGKELSAHATFALHTGTKVYFADPHSPWQRPTNENTNGLLRQYFPKGTDLSRWSAGDLEAVALAVNNRPRKVLGWRTPAEVFAEQLQSVNQSGVASTVELALFAALDDEAGVLAHRRGALERVGFVLDDFFHARRRRVDVEERMTAVLEDLGVKDLASSVPGLGSIGAAAILAQTGDPRRFTSARALVKHAGLAPRERSSGTFVGRTKVTGQGRPGLRLAAWRGIWERFSTTPSTPPATST